MESGARKRSLVWAVLLILLGIAILLEPFIALSVWVWVAILAVAGLAVFGVYLTDRTHWPLLIPAYALWAVAGMISLIELNILRDEFIATYVLTIIALPFLWIFLRKRDQWWALIPAYVLVAVGVMVGLIGRGVLDDNLVPVYVMFAIAIPFLAIFALNPKKWWALIPGGIMVAIGLSFILAGALIQYVAAAAALIIIGVWILVRQFVRKEPAAPAVEMPSPPNTTPDELPPQSK